RTNPDTTGGILAICALSTIAGSAASDDRAANATAWAGAHSVTNAPGDMPPTTIPIGYSSTAPTISVNDTTRPMYAATAAAADNPSFAASGTARANTPIGATVRMAPTSRCMASAT